MQGLVSDSTILYTSDVELVDIKFVEGDPVVVVQFSCQQLNCTRDKFGNVVEGSPTDVQRVYYFWALQQEDAGKFHLSQNLPPLCKKTFADSPLRYLFLEGEILGGIFRAFNKFKICRLWKVQNLLTIFAQMILPELDMACLKLLAVFQLVFWSII